MSDKKVDFKKWLMQINVKKPQKFISPLSDKQPIPTPTSTPTPSYTVDQYLREIMPKGDKRSLNEYYPAYEPIGTMSAQLENQTGRKGAAALTKLIGLGESTLGRNNVKPFNFFGMLPPASSGFKGYSSDVEAVQKFQESLKGMRNHFYPIFKENQGKPITTKDIDELYSKTDKHGMYGSVGYLDELKRVWKKMGY